MVNKCNVAVEHTNKGVGCNLVLIERRMKLLFNDKSCIFVCLIQWISSSELNAFLDCMCAKMDSANLFHRSSTEEKCWICCNLTVSPIRLLDELECSHCVCSYGCLRSVILQ